MNDDDRIEASLRRAFAPPDLTALHRRVAEAAARAEASAPTRSSTPWIAAAAFAAAAAAVLLLLRRDDAVPQVPDVAQVQHVAPDPGRSVGLRLAQLHAHAPALPTRTDGACLAEPPPAPGACVGDGPRFDPGDELEPLGECGGPGGPACDRATIPTPRLIHVRDRSGAELLVCIAPLQADPRPSLPDDAGLSIFRRELGGFVAYEITPLSEPLALARLVP
ncbi:MAG: hypothetical protein K1X88_19515 [Nannocystaceae bacterium]|nr:hypothetical protein [Nannocystaceae bacterium]